VIPDDAAVTIRTGAVLLEIGDQSSHPGVIDHAEVIQDSLGPFVKIRGVLGIPKPGS